jgi:hypothetical protein
MSDFITSISTTAHKEKMKREYRENHFSLLTSLHQTQEIKLYDIILDSQLVDVSTLKHKVARCIEFVHLRNLTQRYNSRFWFSICCVCGMKNKMLFVSDLSVSKALINYRPDSFRPGDIIAFANCKLEKHDQVMIITPTKKENMVKIGKNNNIEKCQNISDEIECCGFVDKRIHFQCDYHKSKYYSVSNRMVLRQQSDVIQVLKVVEEKHVSILDRKPAEIVSAEVLEGYMKTYSFKRGTKLFEATKKPDFSIGKTMTLFI